MKTIKKKQINSFIITIFIIGVVLRLILLFSNQDMWHDASFSVLYAEKPLKYIIDSNDVHPPLYYLYLKSFLLVSDNEIWIRVSSLMLWMVFFYWFNKLLFNNYEGIGRYISLLFITISPTFVYYSIEPRNYMLGLVFVIIQLYCFFEIKKGNDKPTLFTIMSILMLYTHYFTVFVLFIELIYLLLNQRDKLKELALEFIYIGAVALPLFFYLMNTMPKIEAFWFKEITILSFFSTISYQFWFPDTLTLINIFVLVFLGFIIKLTIPQRFLIVFFFFPVMLTWLISQIYPIYHHRFFLFYTPALYILIGVAIGKLYNAGCIMKNLFSYILFFIMISLFLTSNAKMIENLPQDIYNSQKFLKDNYIDEDELTYIVHVSSFSQTPYNYYFRDYKVLNFLKTELNNKQLFTAGGSVIPKWSIINNTIDFEQYYLVTHKVMLGEKEIFNEGGLRIYDIRKDD